MNQYQQNLGKGEKKMKKFLSLALALIMVLSLVACGDTASDNTDNSNTDAIPNRPARSRA